MAVLADERRLAAARRARRVLPALPMPVDGIARLAARLIGAPIAIVAVTDVEEEHFVGSCGLPPPLDTREPVPAAYSVCRYVVSADHPVVVGDMTADPDLAGHALAVEFGARAFAGVPLRDADDRTIGSLLVVDTVVRGFTEADVTLLVEIAALLAEPAGDGGLDAVLGVEVDSAALLDGVQEAFIAIDATGTIVGWNPAATEMLGWAATEAHGRTVADLILPDLQRDQLRVALPELMVDAAPGAGRSVQTVVRHRDGRELTVQATLSSLRGRRGPLVCAFLIDVTGRHEAERDAGAQRGFLRALLDSLDAGVLAVDDSGQPIVCNRALRRIHGIADTWTPQELHHLYAERVRRPDGGVLPLELSPLSRAVHGETVRDHEMLFRIPGQNDRIFSGNAQPVVGPDGHRLGAVLALHEITERRRVERFRDCQVAVAGVLAGAGSLEAAAPEITRSVATALGWPRVDLNLADEVTGALRQVGRHARSDSRAESAIGASPRTEIAVPILDGDAVVGVLACFAEAPDYDRTRITALLAAIAEQLGQFRVGLRAEQLSREVDQYRLDFLALVGHEVRTPLTSISAAVQMLVDDGGPEDLQPLIQGIARNTAALCAIVDELLDLAALERGHEAIARRPVDLAEIARRAVHDANAAAAGHGITVTAQIGGEPVVDGDPSRLRQVLDNLLTNAVKYSRNGDLVRLTLDGDDRIVTITVTDSGIGVPPDERERLFERFYRATNVRHQGIPGTGLGLPLVRAIVEAHDGTVVISDPGSAGTAFTVRIPVAAAPPVHRGPAGQIRPATAGR